MLRIQVSNSMSCFVYACMHRCMQVLVYVCRGHRLILVSSSITPLILWDSLLLNLVLPDWLNRLASKLWRSTCLQPQSCATLPNTLIQFAQCWGCRCSQSHPAFFHRSSRCKLRSLCLSSKNFVHRASSLVPCLAFTYLKVYFPKKV